MTNCDQKVYSLIYFLGFIGTVVGAALSFNSRKYPAMFPILIGVASDLLIFSVVYCCCALASDRKRTPAVEGPLRRTPVVECTEVVIDIEVPSDLVSSP